MVGLKLDEVVLFRTSIRVIIAWKRCFGKSFLFERRKGMSYYVYPDGTITEEPLSFMSDDYFIIQAEDEEEAYEQALMRGLI